MGIRTSMANWLLKGLSDDMATFMTTSTSSTAPTRGTKELLAAWRTSPWLRAVTEKIAWSVASVPWTLQTEARNGRPVRNRRIQRTNDHDMRKASVKRLDQHKQLQVVDDHPLLDLLEDGNPELSGLSMRSLAQLHLDLVGESFVEIRRNGIGVPEEIWSYPSNWVTDVPIKERPTYRVQTGNSAFEVKRENMIWLRRPNPAQPYLRGVGIGESLSDEIETDEYASKMIKTFFYNKAHPDLMIAVEGSDGRGPSREELERARQQFDQQHRGWQRANRSFWTSGKITIKELQQKFADMELSSLRSWERDAFINVYGMPPELLGLLTNSNRATVTQALTIFARMVLVPRLEFLRTELQRRLVPMYDDRLILDYESPVPTDEDLRLEYLRIAPWAITRGEWRELQGFEDRGAPDAVHMNPLGNLPEPAPVQQRSVSENSDTYSIYAWHDAASTLVQIKAPFDVDNVLESLVPERLTENLRPLWDESIADWGQRIMRELGIDPSAFDILNPVIARHLEEFAGNRIRDINNNTREELRATLTTGVRAGEGIDDLAKRVKHTFDVAETSRAKTIARTEVLRSSNFATMTAHKLSGVVQRRQWIHTPDSRVRDLHAALGNSDPVGIDEPFTIGGLSAMYPGGFGIPEQDINCRCTTVAVITDDEEERSSERLGMHWKAFDRALIPWEEKAEEQARKGFEAQRSDVLAALRRENVSAAA